VTHVLEGLLKPREEVSLTREPAQRDPRTYRMAALFGLVALMLSAFGSWIPSFWGDEAASIMSAERPLPSLFVMLGHVDAVHGTYYLFLHYWINLFGASPIAARFPSAVAVGIMIVGVVILAEKLAGFRLALLAGLVCLLLPRVTYMGAEARSYAFSATCAVWLTLLLVRLLENRESRILPWAAYSVLLAASTYVFLFSMLMVIVHAVIILSVTRERRFVRAWITSASVGVALAAPVIFWALTEHKQIAYLADRDALSLGEVGINQWFGNVGYAILAWVLVALAIAIALLSWRRSRATGAAPSTVSVSRQLTPIFARSPLLPSLFVVAVAWAFIPLVLLVGVSLFSPVYSSRYLSFAAPGVALLLGLVISLAVKRWVTVVALTVLLGAAIPSYVYQRTPYAENNSDWAEVANTVQDHARPGDAVVFDESTLPSRRLRLAMHTYPDAFAGLYDVTLKTPYADTNWWWDSVYPVNAVPERFGKVDRVWLLEYKLPGAKPDTYGMAALKNLGFSVQQTYVENTSEIYVLDRS